MVKEALTKVLERVERRDGWATDPDSRTGLAGYDLWAAALETGRAIYAGQAYLTSLWLECREMAVEFLKEAKERLPGRCDTAFGEAAGHYMTVRDKLRALLEMHPDRGMHDWQMKLTSPEGAAERSGVDSLRQITGAL